MNIVLIENGREHSKFEWTALIVFWALAIFCVGTGIWFIFDTLATFPNDSFSDNLPGLVLFPFIMLCIAGICVMRGWMYFEGMGERR